MVFMNNSKYKMLVVIINYKTPELIEGALNSLAKELNYKTDKVVIVDNFSNDGSVEKIASFLKSSNFEHWAELIASPVNGGFSAGNNIGIKANDADYYLLLNSDAYVRVGAVDNLITSMADDDKLGIVGPRLEWESGEKQESCFYNLTPFSELLNGAGTGLITRFFNIFDVKEVAQGSNQREDNPDWISFACVLIRKEVFDVAGLMDENYFMYFEDSDFCRAAKSKNFTIKYEPNASVVHLNQGYSNAKKNRLPAYFHRSRSRYFKKHYGFMGLLLANILWSIGRIILIIRELITLRSDRFSLINLIDIWRGFWS